MPPTSELGIPPAAHSSRGADEDEQVAAPVAGGTDEDQRLRLAFETGLGVPFTQGNRITVLRNGCRIFPAMLEAIAASRDSIDFLTFVYWQGEIAERFAAALAERARAGVRVQVILDGVGASSMSGELLVMMERAGVEIAWFRPPVRWKLWEVDNRTHRKVMVCDGRLGFTGGVGIAAEWEGDARSSEEWRDTHFRIEGPAVRGLQGAFLQEWAECERPIGTYQGTTVPDLPQDGSSLIQVLKTTATVNWSDITTLYQLLVINARERVRITTAYLVPGDRLVELLRAAAQRGVVVELLVPGAHTDERLVQLAGRHRYRELFEAGVKLSEYQPSMLHAKIITVDQRLSVIGSANVNQRSMSKDDELALVVIDRELCAELDRDFERDQESAKEFDLGRWQERSWWGRVKERCARVFTPQL